MNPDPRPDPLAGTQLGDFVIEGLVGKGAMGAVYRARQISLGRPVALKVMRPEFAAEEEMVARFRREARAAGAISHPHLIGIYSFGQEGETCFFAMELVEGQSLRAHLKRGERFTEAECLEIGRQVLAGLREAHRAGIVHRDIKPDNLMLDGRRQVRVADLGLARVAGPESGLAVTMTGMMMGTPLYIAPEQAEGRREVDYRADFYALGATLYHLATGRPPYDGSSGVEVIGKHLHAPVPDARASNSGLSRPFAELLKRLMAKKPEDRPQKHSEIERELDRCGALLAEEYKEQSRIARSAALKVVKRSWVDEPVTWIAAAVVAVVLVAGGFLYPHLSKGPDADAVLGMGSTMADGRLPTGDGTTKGTKDTTPESSSSRFSSPAPVASSLIAATKDKPFVNSLGMKFVPMPGTKVLFSIWETRVRDFEAFVKETGYNWNEKLTFKQSPDDPVVKVSWDDAKAFCEWLSKKEGKQYRLPTDEEWSAAAGGAAYPWGHEWPPPPGTGNFPGEESKLGEPDDPKDEWMTEGYRDEHPRTAPVDSYRAVPCGLYHLVGNAWEWCEDWFDQGILKKHRAAGPYEPKPEDLADIMRGDVRKVLRGGSWLHGRRDNLRSSNRHHTPPASRFIDNGFRCVVVSPSSAALPAVAQAPSTHVAPEVASATKENPLVNSLGMRFVQIPGTQVLFSIWETRVKDFGTFVSETGYDWHEKPSFEQGPDHPVVQVSWNDAKAFCDWLSKKEGRQYRLPTDDEWDAAAGSAIYPWGDAWPPPAGAGNFAGEESKLGQSEDPKDEWMTEGYRDEHPRTAPVGSYRALESGLYDLSGNVWEWCEDWFNQRMLEKRWAAGSYEPTPEDLADIVKGDVRKELRGGSWRAADRLSLRSSYRVHNPQSHRAYNVGFRCVVVGPVSVTSPPASALSSAVSIPTEATKDKPFVNSLGMRFVPAHTPGVLFCIWETRVMDFDAFAGARAMTPAIGCGSCEPMAGRSGTGTAGAIRDSSRARTIRWSV
ncbi:MAG TPA: bifunctional serine/threonine-protein kinase/formylglycine-generating enzyme family protein [Verrucomicrobiae bacterium]|nr:bifunctional serine/threonine-protein kinase/formylglycine-generating enzyme family protein [Verrucomicrobiae bacterium]